MFENVNHIVWNGHILDAEVENMKMRELFNGECEMSDLKPCPFCGVEPMTFKQTGLIICSYAMCGVNPESKSKEDWNKRTDDRLEQENAELRAFKERALYCLDYTLNWAPASWQAQTVEDLLESQKENEEKVNQILNK